MDNKQDNSSSLSSEKKCKKNHNLIQIKKDALPRSYQNKYSSVNCDECKRSDIDQIDDYYHCSECCYDICLQCYQKEQNIERNDRKCNNNHNMYLIKKDYLPRSYQNIYSSVNCDECKRSSIEEIDDYYHCSECLYDICFKCCSNDNIQRNDKKCKNNHSVNLIKKDTLPKQYHNIYSSVSCDECKRKGIQKMGDYYNCPDCSYDKCFNCELSELNNITCRNNHSVNLIKKGSLPRSYQNKYSNVYCNECERSDINQIDDYYHCSECQYDICLNCGQKEQKMERNDRKCKNNHSTNLIKKGSLPRSYQNKYNSVECNECKRSRIEQVDDYYHCSECLFDQCLNCDQKEQNIGMSDRKCKSNHDMRFIQKGSLPLSYLGVYMSVKCNECKTARIQQIDGYYHCSKCSYDLCLNCDLAQITGPTDIQCENNHNMKLMKQDTLPPVYEAMWASVSCNNCKENRINKNGDYYHCTLCQYDLCQKCKRKQQTSVIDWMQQALMKDRFCRDKHKMSVYTKQQTPPEYRGYPKCNECGEKEIQNQEYYYHCKSCSYDLCSRCDRVLLCSNGHPMSYSSHLQQCQNNYSTRCSICLYQITDNTQEQFECRVCNFDKCMKCIQMKRIQTLPQSLCPQKHLLKYFESGHWYSTDHSCDICRVNIFQEKLESYNCSLCNFDRCQKCFQQVSEKK